MDRLIKDFQVNCKNCNLDTICLPRGLSKKEVEDLSIVVKSNAVIQKGEYILRAVTVADFYRLIFADNCVAETVA